MLRQKNIFTIINLRIITTIILFMTFWSCVKETDTNELYTPYLTSTRSNKKVTLKWGNPGCEYSYDCPQLNPDYFEILMSETDPAELKSYGTVSNSIFEVSISNLTNGKPYYFAVKAVGRNSQFTISKTIMTIPDNPETIQSIFKTVDRDRYSGTWSPDQSSVAYVRDYNGSQAVFVSNLTGNAERLIEISSCSPEWSPDGQNIVYHTDHGEVNSSQGHRPNHIAVYNIKDSTIKRLTVGNYFDYLPTWSADGKWVTFLSDRSGSKEYNLWQIPLDSNSAIQITTDFNDLTDLWSTDERSPKTLSCSKDGKNIAFARLTKLNKGYNYDIYCVPSTGGNRTTLVSSQWDDFCPVYSPDGNSIAFVSNRSGANEIWSIDLKTKKLKQITGSTGKWVVYGYGKIEWSSSGNKILFTSYYNEEIDFTLFSVDLN
jgi:Tol biopolymer transport system component